MGSTSSCSAWLVKGRRHLATLSAFPLASPPLDDPDDDDELPTGLPSYRPVHREGRKKGKKDGLEVALWCVVQYMLCCCTRPTHTHTRRIKTKHVSTCTSHRPGYVLDHWTPHRPHDTPCIMYALLSLVYMWRIKKM